MKRLRNSLPTLWIADLKSDEERQSFSDHLYNNFNTPAFKRLKTIIRAKLEELESQDLTKYGSPSWAYEQAHRNGSKQTLKQLLDLLSFVKD